MSIVRRIYLVELIVADDIIGDDSPDEELSEIEHLITSLSVSEAYDKLKHFLPSGEKQSEFLFWMDNCPPGKNRYIDDEHGNQIAVITIDTDVDPKEIDDGCYNKQHERFEP